MSNNALDFDLGRYYADFLKALEKDFTSLLLADKQVKKEQLVITRSSDNLKGTTLVETNEYDDIYFGLINRKTRINLEIFSLGKAGIEVIFEHDVKDEKKHRLKVSVRELLTDENIVAACILWMITKEQTPWLSRRLGEEASAQQ